MHLRGLRDLGGGELFINGKSLGFVSCTIEPLNPPEADYSREVIAYKALTKIEMKLTFVNVRLLREIFEFGEGAAALHQARELAAQAIWPRAPLLRPL